LLRLLLGGICGGSAVVAHLSERLSSKRKDCERKNRHRHCFHDYNPPFGTPSKLTPNPVRDQKNRVPKVTVRQWFSLKASVGLIV
jgi:hypothetical protein